MLDIPISMGSLPSVDLQVNNPRLRNAFVNDKEEVQLLPNIAEIVALGNTRAILKSSYRDRWIIATFSEIFYLENDVLTKVGDITYSTAAVRMDENLQNQVGIANGSGAWVYSQRTPAFEKLDNTNGFTLSNPTDVTVLDTIMVFTGGDDKAWIVSEADNALVYNANQVIPGDTRMGRLVGVRALDNNLFIFGEGAVQRWLPDIQRLPISFPFTEDPSYRDEYGCKSTASLLSQNNEIYYLTSNGQIRLMKSSGFEIITNDGISNIINQYSDQASAFGSYYYHKGAYLYHLSFPDTETSWIYHHTSKKWSESDELIIGSDEIFISQDQLVITKDGVYQLTSDYSDGYWEVVIQTPYMDFSHNAPAQRSILNNVLLLVTQGKSALSGDQICDLQLSKDNILYGNRVRRRFGGVAQRLRQLRWYMNYTNTHFSMRFIFQLKEDITIKNAKARITSN